MDLVLVLLLAFVMKAWLSGEGLSGLFDDLSKKLDAFIKGSQSLLDGAGINPNVVPLIDSEQTDVVNNAAQFNLYKDHLDEINAILSEFKAAMKKKVRDTISAGEATL